MNNRAADVATFLQKTGWQDAARTPLAGDASPRRYERLRRNTPPFRAVLMDAQPASGEDVQPFVTIDTYLRDIGLSAPAIYARDTALGLLLLEDLGDDLLARVCAHTPRFEPVMYRRAIDVLAYLHRPRPLPDVPAYDLAALSREADLLTEWYLPAATATIVSPEVQATFSTLMRAACQPVEQAQSCLVLRDYHAENLLWLPDRDGVQQIGLLDFQDALIGHPAYDLVSVLEDARRDTTPELQDAMIARYLVAIGLSEAGFRQAYAILGAQRNLKIIGIFSRLCVRDAKQHYVDLIPRVWAHLQNNLAHPSLAALADWVARHVPAPDTATLNRIRNQAK